VSDEDSAALTAPVVDPATVIQDPPTVAEAREPPAQPRPPAATPAWGQPTRVGRYTILGELGRGGMGAVYTAYDDELDRKVAIKVLLGDADSSARARILRESRALARLSHPNVVQVYDVGDHAGAIYIAMEYIQGLTLRQWVRQQQRPWYEVLAMLTLIGRGLAAAHEAGLVHRDLKPANVLVGADGRPRVLDFGLARAHGPSAEEDPDTAAQPPELHAASESLSASLHSKDLLSGPLTQADTLLGTPAYMAPEQWRRRPAGPAADQYAFAVTLYEALYGRRPFESTRGMVELRERVLAGAVPPPPKGSKAPTRVAAILRRALAVDPAARWSSLAEMLDALAAVLDARAGQRRRGAMAAFTLGAALLGAAAWHQREPAGQRCTGATDRLIGVWDDDRRADVERAITAIDRPYAPRALAAATAALDTYATDWAAMHTDACLAHFVRDAQSSEIMDRRMACLDRAALDLRAVAARLADADDVVVRNAHTLVGGLPSLARCADVEALLAEVEPPPPDEAEAVAAIRARLADTRAATRSGRYGEATTALAQAQTMADQLTYGPLRVEIAILEGNLAESLGRYDNASTAYTAAIEAAARWRDWSALAWSAMHLAHLVGYRQGRAEEARYQISLARGAAAGDRAIEAAIANAAGLIADLQGQFAAAELELRRSLELWEAEWGPTHPNTIGARNNLANLLDHQGRFAEAEAEHRRVLALWQQTLGADHPHSGVSLNNLGMSLQRLGRWSEAEDLHRRALALWRSSLGDEHPHVAIARNNLAVDLAMRGEHAAAEAEHRLALALRERLLPADHPYIALSRSNLAWLLLAMARPSEALPLAEAAWERRQRADIPARDRAETAMILARALTQTGDPAARARALDEAAATAAHDLNPADKAALAELELVLATPSAL
jgi:tRNA A-37 threonylcarbamoyl transferase component Bud32/tetratricopeptide (TPR) repeat protein